MVGGGSHGAYILNEQTLVMRQLYLLKLKDSAYADFSRIRLVKQNLRIREETDDSRK